MKNWIFLGIILLLTALLFSFVRLNVITKKWKTAEANVKSYVSLLDDETTTRKALQLSVNQLEYFNDSILKKLNATREELKIKDKQLKVLHYVESDFSRTDTIEVVDTIFKSPEIKMDTTISDKWYSLKIGLEYPSTITAKASFKSEKHIVVYTKKETVNPPKKFFLFKWFQKKHVLVNVDVVEKNPYMEEEVSRYVEIIK